MKDTQLRKIVHKGNNWYEIEEIDLTIPENQIKLFNFNLLLRDRDIDSKIGRNVMLAYLRLFRIINYYNKPRKDTDWFRLFKIDPNQNPATNQKFSSKNTCIYGRGILLIREEIKKARAKGAGI